MVTRVDRQMINPSHLKGYLAPTTADPTTRDNSDPLQEGDFYYNTNADVLKVYDGSSWTSVSSTDARLLAPSSGTPTTRDDSSALQEGDLHYRNDLNVLRLYDGSNWITMKANVLAASGSDPSTRDDGSALQEGDIWYDTSAGQLKTYNGTAFTVVASGGSSDRVLAPSASDPTTRDDASALQEGDFYYNTADDQLKAYDGSTWNPVGAGAPTGAVYVYAFTLDDEKRARFEFPDNTVGILTIAPSVKNNGYGHYVFHVSTTDADCYMRDLNNGVSITSSATTQSPDGNIEMDWGAQGVTTTTDGDFGVMINGGTGMITLANRKGSSTNLVVMFATDNAPLSTTLNTG